MSGMLNASDDLYCNICIYYYHNEIMDINPISYHCLLNVLLQKMSFCSRSLPAAIEFMNPGFINLWVHKLINSRKIHKLSLPSMISILIFFKKQQTFKRDTRNTSNTTHIPLPSFAITIPLRKPVTVEPHHERDHCT